MAYSAEFSVEQGARMASQLGRKMWDTIYKVLTNKSGLPGDEVWEQYFGMTKTGTAQEKADYTLIKKYLLENETYNPVWVNKWPGIWGDPGGIAGAYYNAYQRFGPGYSVTTIMQKKGEKYEDVIKKDSDKIELEQMNKFKQAIRSDTVEGIRLANEFDNSSDKKSLQERYKCNPLTTDAYYSAGYD